MSEVVQHGSPDNPEQGFLSNPDQERDFATALRGMVLQGRSLARKGWNGKGMYIQMYTPSSCHSEASNGNSLPYIRMYTADGKYVPWLASQTDLLSTDWVEVREERKSECLFGYAGHSWGHVVGWCGEGEFTATRECWDLDPEEGRPAVRFNESTGQWEKEGEPWQPTNDDYMATDWILEP